MKLEKVFDFIKEKRGYDYPYKYKLVNELPLTDDELYVNDYLMLRDSNIKRIPDGFYITGSLDLNNSKIKHLPDNLHVGGYLDLRKTNLKKLPNNMDVGSLYISDTEIDSIPEELFISSKFFVKNTPLAMKYTKDEIKKMITDRNGHIGGDIII
jgi:hypothetical protein